MNRHQIDYACPLQRSARPEPSLLRSLIELARAIVCTAAAVAIGLMLAGWSPL